MLSASDLAGYSTSFYAIEHQIHDRVRLQFRRAEVSRNGQITSLSKEPRLPFALPAKAQYIRLVFLVRAASSDHNMAILASRNLPLLQNLTATLGRNPSACQTNSQAFCSWVPAGIAVRPN